MPALKSLAIRDLPRSDPARDIPAGAVIAIREFAGSGALRPRPLALAQSTHLPALDGFRAFSILAVLACHMLPLGPAQWQGNATAGYMGMSMFFALSGFLIARYLWESPHAGQFFLRRFARILPLVFLVSVVYGLILEGRFDTFLGTNLYILNYWHSALAPSVSPLWSLGVEMHFYIAIGLAVLVFGRGGFWLVPVAALAVLALRIDGEAFGAIQTHLRVDEILSGAMLALLWVHRDRGIAAAVWARLPGLFWPIVVLWALSCWPPSEALGYFRPYFTALMIGAVLAMGGGWQTALLSTRSLRYIATISFALYVWHSPFRHGWFDAGTDLERYLVKRPIGFAATFLLAHLSTFYFEQPIIRAAKSWGQRRRLPAGASARVGE
jgi:peptidoglycan/LPS O-acetylase OafA/YrhL